MHIRMSCRHRRVPRLLGALFGIFESLWKVPPDASELLRIQRRIAWEYAALLDSPASLSSWLCGSALAGLERSPRRRCEELLRVESGDVAGFCERMFGSAPQRIVLVGDISEKFGSKLSESCGFDYECVE